MIIIRAPSQLAPIVRRETGDAPLDPTSILYISAFFSNCGQLASGDSEARHEGPASVQGGSIMLSQLKDFIKPVFHKRVEF